MLVGMRRTVIAVPLFALVAAWLLWPRDCPDAQDMQDMANHSSLVHDAAIARLVSGEAGLWDVADELHAHYAENMPGELAHYQRPTPAMPDATARERIALALVQLVENGDYPRELAERLKRDLAKGEP